MREDQLATTNSVEQESRAPPPTTTASQRDHIPHPILERRLRGGPRRQSAATVRPKAKAFTWSRKEEGDVTTVTRHALKRECDAGAPPMSRSMRTRPRVSPVPESHTPPQTARSNGPAEAATRSVREDHIEEEGAGQT